MKCSLFVPSHITGFFQIIDNPNPVKKGSRGAGVVMDKGVITTLKSSKKDKKITVKINGKIDRLSNSITHKTIELIQQKFIWDSGFKIEHDIQVPIACGFGTSAACALGTSLGLSHLFNLPLNYNQAAEIAHNSEVILGTGLGDLIAETSGGIVLRIKEGPPGFGKLNHIITEPLYVIAHTKGDIDTSSIIQNPVHQKTINLTGEGMLKSLITDPSPSKFMSLSRQFAERTSLMNKEVKEMVDILDDETLGASMAMLGNTAFALSKNPDSSIENSIVGKIDFCGSRFMEI
ncbi:MAG: GHMP kinase [Euryarchaeota archaeon]|nr:GHMP kinase [Euryarchaeota archaeon]MBU4548287.1 GHMP kinase [Euryarchaeota archaeon]MBU4607968.1 GHMP kinase [Euryarchaeota archaeon]MBV1730280.1 GHMP kinase [Methanobacterium sp.]MBV1754010.1 GHMP kinase [Methanobacterium sp.]